jgi:hypothetical protein
MEVKHNEENKEPPRAGTPISKPKRGATRKKSQKRNHKRDTADAPNTKISILLRNPVEPLVSGAQTKTRELVDESRGTMLVLSEREGEHCVQFIHTKCGNPMDLRLTTTTSTTQSMPNFLPERCQTRTQDEQQADFREKCVDFKLRCDQCAEAEDTQQQREKTTDDGAAAQEVAAGSTTKKLKFESWRKHFYSCWNDNDSKITEDVDPKKLSKTKADPDDEDFIEEAKKKKVICSDENVN